MLYDQVPNRTGRATVGIVWPASAAGAGIVDSEVQDANELSPLAQDVRLQPLNQK
jgi:hypothetical protein